MSEQRIAEIRALNELRVAETIGLDCPTRNKPVSEWCSMCREATLLAALDALSASPAETGLSAEDDDGKCKCGPKGTRGWRDPHCHEHGEFPPVDNSPDPAETGRASETSGAEGINSGDALIVNFPVMAAQALADRWSDPEFWKDKGCRMDSQDCAAELRIALGAPPPSASSATTTEQT